MRPAWLVRPARLAEAKRRGADVPVNLQTLLEGADRGDRPRAAVLTMELQRGVMGDLASFPELAAAAAEGNVVANAARLLRSARAAGVPVVHCTAEFRPDRAGTVINTPLHSAVLRRPEHMLAGTPATASLGSTTW